MNVASVMGMVGVAVLGLLVGWWLGKTAGTGALSSLLAGKEAELSARTAEAARAESELQQRDAVLAALREEQGRLIAEHAASKQNAEGLAEQNRKQETELFALREEKGALESEKTRSEEQLKAAQQSMADLTRIKGEMEKAFKALAADALRGANEQFLGLANSQFDAKQQAIDTLLQPVKETLGKLSDQTQGLEVKREGAYKELQEQVRQFQELGLGLKSETSKLSTALKNPSTTGQWGEFVLERVVKLAGMTEHCDFSRQVTSKDGNYRPDLVVHWPNGRNIVVDSKTSVKSYQEAHEAFDESTRRKKLEEHAQQIRQHVDQLGRKKYDESFEDSIDLVVCFIPGEIFFFAAQQIDPEIVEYAARQKVIFATPTTLIALLKAASFGWRQDSMRREAKQILELSQQVYDRLTTAAGHMRKLGKDIKSSVDSYDDLLGSLERMVLPAARKMKDLGLSGKDISDIEPLDRIPRQMQSPDWKLLDVSKAADTVPRDEPLALAAVEERQEE